MHISDTHFGRRAGQWSRDAEYDAVIDEIVGIARGARLDLIVHSGDLFDTPWPGAAEMSRAATLARRLREVAPFVVIAGNHDSAAMFRFLDEVLNDGPVEPGHSAPVRFIHRPLRAAEGGILTYPAYGGEQSIRLAALPYIHPNRALTQFRDTSAASRSYPALLEQVFADLGRGLATDRDPDRVLRVLMAHQYIEGAKASGTERRIGPEDAHSTGVLPQVEYAAIGHIHNPQEISKFAHYAGSPLQLDFGEAGENKSLVIVEANPGRYPMIEPVPLTSGTPLINVEGTLEQIAASADRVGDAYVRVFVDLDEHRQYLAEEVQKALPQAKVVRVVPRGIGGDVPVLDDAVLPEAQRDVAEDFRDYLAEQGFGGKSAQYALDTFTHALATARDGLHGPCVEEEDLRAAIAGAPDPCCSPSDPVSESVAEGGVR